MDNLESYIKLDNDIRQRPIVFQGTHAEWEALSAAEKAYYIDGIVDLSDDSLDPEVVDSIPTQNSTHLVQSGGVWSGLNTVNNNFGTIELSSTAAYAHAVGETFINAAGQMVKCTAAIAVGDTITIGSNVAVTNIASALSKLNSNKVSWELMWFDDGVYVTFIRGLPANKYCLALIVLQDYNDAVLVRTALTDSRGIGKFGSGVDGHPIKGGAYPILVFG